MLYKHVIQSICSHLESTEYTHLLRSDDYCKSLQLTTGQLTMA